MASTRKPSAPKKAPAKKAEPVKLTLVPAAEPPETVRMSPGTFFKGYEDITAFGRDNFDALVQANAVLAKGIEDLGLEMISLTQAHMEDAASVTKAMLTAKTFKVETSVPAFGPESTSAWETCGNNSRPMNSAMPRIRMDSPLSASV